LTCPAREALPVATLLLVYLSGSLAYSNTLTTIRWSHQQGGIKRYDIKKQIKRLVITYSVFALSDESVDLGQ
jgi:hypothetical protein